MESSLSSIWDSRFSDDAGRAVALYTRRQGDQTVDVGDILAATKSQLPYIGPEQLRFHGILGAGTSFRVNREVYTKTVTDPSFQVRPSPYFVAVKHMILSPSSNNDQDTQKRRRLYGNVSREIRVLMYPPLRDHCCIIPILAYGWTNHPSEGANPYLIVDYSDHGTLNRYLRRCRIPLLERRELAVDVAVGIKVLHDNKIIHGDVKPENILVFDSANDYSPRPQTAKLADFGSSLFEQDVENDASYLGTPFFNAPEIEGRPRCNGGDGHSQGTWGIANDRPIMSQYRKADIYSFGLLLWETVKNGIDIIEKPWLTEGESEMDFLQRISRTESNGMLHRAQKYCEKLKNDGVKESLLSPIKETFGLSLLDDASERADIDEIIASLSRGSDETRGPTRYPLVRISPPLELDGPIPENAEHLQRAMPLPKQVLKARYIPIKYNPQPRKMKGGETFSLDPYVKENARPPNQNFIYKALDMFQVAVAMSPPWNVQADIVDKLKLDITYERDPVKHAEASLQLSICYRLGFGIEPDIAKSIECLANAVADNSVAQAIFHHVWQANAGDFCQALSSPPSLTAFDWKLYDVNQEEYFVRRIQTYRQPFETTTSISPFLSAAANGVEITIEKLLRSDDITQSLLSEAVLLACENGQYGVLRLLLPKCLEYHGLTTNPTPLHWLIMFNEPELSQLAGTLVKRPSELTPGRGGMCENLLGSMPNSPVSFPRHCMELIGSPLHWAVRVNHEPLVDVLIKLGADINLRWRAPRQLSDDPTTLSIPDYSPLDLAVAFHLPDVVDILLAAGADTDNKSSFSQYSSFHVIGQTVFPFAHDVLHGKHRREALRRVIDSLKKAGCGINSLDSEGRSPLARALENPDLPDYVLQELVDAGALVCHSITRQNENAAIVIARNSIYRRLTTSKMSFVLPRIPNLNEKDNRSPSWNALHHCTAAMSGNMVEVLLSDQRISVDEKTSDNQTALHLAAAYGSADIVHLLVRAGASLTAKNHDTQTPLEIATLRRWIDVVHILVQLGSPAIFTADDEQITGTVLHAAAANANDGNAIVSEILDSHDSIRQNKSIVDSRDCRGWTALHQSTYYGDKKSVIALINAGADCSIPTFDGAGQGSKTALDIANEVLANISANTLGSDHERIRDGGPPGVTSFRARLVDIRDMLKHGL